MRIPALSVEYLHVAVTANVTLTALTVEMAVIRDGTALSSSDFHTAAWSAGEAVMLVGPGQTVTLTAGLSYNVYVRVASSPEIPVMRAGIVYAE
ncbi:MAG: hypothetical protein JWN52_8081 [Actinomycetia bacterium]|nr:hypothetical protein [Actinomycetes bacterium]